MATYFGIINAVVLLILTNNINCQFGNLYGGLLGGNGQTGTGSNCTNNRVSCLPWCTRVADAKGCYSCNCNSGAGMNPMGGMNPMNPMMGGNPMMGANPMANMYSGLQGGQSPMMGGGPRQGMNCGQVPRTCPFPQPWCQRVADNNGCVKCLCGNDLAEFMQKFTGQTQKANDTTTTPSTTSTGKPSTSTTTSRMTSSTAPNSMSCLLNFYCTKTCDNGYKSDSNNCPVCECMDGFLIDTPVDATDPPGKHAPKTTSLPVPIVTSGVTSCPGIFDCGLICNSGYKTDAMGCPVCQCMAN